MAIVVLAIVQSVQAQQSGKIARVGLARFHRGVRFCRIQSEISSGALRELGYVEGRDFTMEFRHG